MSQDVTMYSGDSKTLTISIVDGDGDAVDVSTAAAVVYAIADSSRGPAHVTKTLADGVSVAGSTVTVTLEPDDTAALAGVYYHELQITDESGNVDTALSGAITVQRDLVP